MNSFERYLLSISTEEAIQHVIVCLKNSSGNLAWVFMETYLGPDWSCRPENLSGKVLEALDIMRSAHR